MSDWTQHTIDEIENNTRNIVKSEIKNEVKNETKYEVKNEVKSETKNEVKPEVKNEHKLESKLETKNDTQYSLITSSANPSINRLPSPLNFDITRGSEDLDVIKKVEEPKITFISIYEQDILTYKEILGNYKNFSFVHGDVIEQMETGKYDTVVSPANSFGFMESGIDSYYLRYFGNDLQVAVQNVITRKYHGDLPVGRGMLLQLKKAVSNPKYFMVAPTTRSVNDVSATINAYLAFKAILEVIEKSQLVTSVLVPCLATGIGRMSAKKSAKQIKMAMDAYLKVLYGDVNFPSIFDIHKNGSSTLVRKNTEYMLSE